MKIPYLKKKKEIKSCHDVIYTDLYSDISTLEEYQHTNTLIYSREQLLLSINNWLSQARSEYRRGSTKPSVFNSTLKKINLVDPIAQSLGTVYSLANRLDGAL